MTHDALPARLWRLRYAMLYVALAARFAFAIASVHDERVGFTPLIFFGGNFEARRLPRLDAGQVLTVRGSTGYDGQFYAQLAVAGNPFDCELRTALDSAPYRERRILLPLVAHVLGWGRDDCVLQIYALANLACWLALALLLARWWFPPTDMHNFLRWTGTLFGAGMVGSVTQSLTDGPALLVLAAGVRALERDRRVLAALALGVAGLVRETSVLAATIFAPPDTNDRAAWRRAARYAVIAVGPVLLWSLVLRVHYGETGGLRNIARPLTGCLEKLREIQAGWSRRGFAAVEHEVLALLALLVQVGFIVARPKPRLTWWRVGVAFTLLWLCLGPAVWEGPHSAVARAVLPLTLAFNVLAPRNSAGLALLAAGNLTVLSAPWIVSQIPSTTTTITRDVALDYREGWYPPERRAAFKWRWTGGDAVLVVRNRGGENVQVTLKFGLRSPVDRTLTIDAAGAKRSVVLAANKFADVAVGPFGAAPGDTVVRFTSPQPAWHEPSAAGGRMLTAAVYDLRAAIVIPSRNGAGSAR